MDTNRVFLYIKFLAIIGIILAIYLLWQQFNRPIFSPCYINSFINCNSIISGPVSKTLGLPTPLFGLIGYILILSSAILQKKKILFSVASFGVVFCLWIAYREIFELRVICPVCILCQLLMITISFLSVILIRRKSG